MIKFLLCKPTFYGVKYEINPWMDIEKSPSWGKANSQWNKLKTVIFKCKAKVNYLNPSPALPDMVFTANAGILKGDTFIPSNFLHKERQGEKDHFKRWFKEAGYQVGPGTVSRLLKKLGFSIKANKKDTVQLKSPNIRQLHRKGLFSLKRQVAFCPRFPADIRIRRR